jgi:hypothetical protein
MHLIACQFQCADAYSFVFSITRLDFSSFPFGKLAAYKFRDRCIPGPPAPPRYLVERSILGLIEKAPDVRPTF